MLAMRWVLFCNPVHSVLVLALPGVVCCHKAAYSNLHIRSLISGQLVSMHMQWGCSHIRASDGIFILWDLAVNQMLTLVDQTHRNKLRMANRVRVAKLSQFLKNIGVDVTGMLIARTLRSSVESQNRGDYGSQAFLILTCGFQAPSGAHTR